MLNKVLSMPLRAKMVAGTALATVGSTMLPVIAYAADVSSNSLDVSSVVTMVQAVMSLLTTPPLSYFLCGGLALMAFRIFKGGKNAAN